MMYNVITEAGKHKNLRLTLNSITPCSCFSFQCAKSRHSFLSCGGFSFALNLTDTAPFLSKNKNPDTVFTHVIIQVLLMMMLLYLL